MEDAILAGLEGFVNFAKTIENAPPLSTELPGIDKSLAQLIGLSGAVDRNVRQPVVSYFATDLTPTFAEFARVVSPALGPWGPASNPNGSAFEFGVDLSRSFTAEDLRLDLGAALDTLGIEVDASLDLETFFGFVDQSTLQLPASRWASTSRR